MRLALHGHALNIDQFQVNLMHQRRCLQNGLPALPFHEVNGKTMKLTINAWREQIKRGGIAPRPCKEKLCRIRDLAVCFHGGFRIT